MNKNLAVKKAISLKIWENREWHKLLYYKKKLFGLKTVSQNINKAFFISVNGKKSPKDELLESLKLLFENPKNEDNNFRCAFPQRFIYLQKKLKPLFEELPPVACSKLNNWKKRLKPRSVSLLFAGGYLNNPSTLYGHTFLRLKKTDETNDLLDYTINYAAETDDKNGILFALQGLAGLYPGKFSTVPYYLKIQEYHNLENRDLWEFPLNLNNEEVDRLLNHAWELGKAGFPYYFFTKNCSWQLIPLLNIAKPEFNLDNKFTTWVIPSDTILYFLNNFPETQNFSWRPSFSKFLKWEESQLSEKEREIALKIAKEPSLNLNLIAGMSKERQALILEISADYVKFKFYSKKIKKQDWDQKSNFILSKRAELGPLETFLGAPAPPSTLLDAHNSGRVSLGQIYFKNRFLQNFTWRFAIQDLLDKEDGYLPNAELEIGKINFLYDNKYKKIHLREFKLANVLSLTPFTSFEKRKSWQMQAGLKEPENKINPKNRQLIAEAAFNSGISFTLDSNLKTIGYILPEINIGLGGALDDNYKAGLGYKMGFYSKSNKKDNQKEQNVTRRGGR
ncbi:MAG: DUF4105 domain-containing protein [Elusimicrobiota bacterium]|nr:DUF4105 domain-containing protein [Elusimicrobiota bacterium]